MGLDSAEKVRARCPARQGPGPGPESFVGGELPAQAIRVTSPAVTLTLAESDRDRDCQSDSEALRHGCPGPRDRLPPARAGVSI